MLFQMLSQRSPVQSQSQSQSLQPQYTDCAHHDACDERELTDTELHTVVGGKRANFLSFTHPLPYHTLFLPSDGEVEPIASQASLSDQRERDLNRNYRVHRLNAQAYA